MNCGHHFSACAAPRDWDCRFCQFCLKFAATPDGVDGRECARRIKSGSRRTTEGRRADGAMDRHDCAGSRDGSWHRAAPMVPAASKRSTAPPPSCEPGRLGWAAASRTTRCCPCSWPGSATAIPLSGWRLTKSCANGPDRISDICPGPAPKNARARSSAGEPGCRRGSLASRPRPS